MGGRVRPRSGELRPGVLSRKGGDPVAASRVSGVLFRGRCARREHFRVLGAGRARVFVSFQGTSPCETLRVLGGQMIIRNAHRTLATRGSRCVAPSP
jgi:hypothetical protein